jgi:hypothetical protein
VNQKKISQITEEIFCSASFYENLILAKHQEVTLLKKQIQNESQESVQ